MNRLQTIFFIIFLCVIHAFAQAQSKEVPDVELVEEKLAKRWLLYAINNTDEEQEAFLIVQGEGFRRSADRPVIKKIPPKAKVLMITLIPLKDANPTYTKIFKYDTDLQSISKRKGENDEEHVNIRPLKDDEFTIFIDNECDKCKLLLDFMNKNHYKYRILNIKTNHKVNEFLFDHLKTTNYKGGIIDLPVIFYEGRKHWSIVDIEEFIKNYNWDGFLKN